MALADILQKAYDNNLVVSDLTIAALQQIQDIASEFNLVPDNMIDIKRLPGEVLDLKTLKTWMIRIREELAKLDEKDRKKSELVTGGILKLYRTVILCIHCLNNFMKSGGAKENMAFKAFRDAVFDHGAANPPGEMSDAGKKAWEASIVNRTVRVKNVMGAIIILASPNTEVKVDGLDSRMAIRDGGLVVENEAKMYVGIDDAIEAAASDDEESLPGSEKGKTDEPKDGENADNFQDSNDDTNASNDDPNDQEDEASVHA
jgi:hypothetical protein